MVDENLTTDLFTTPVCDCKGSYLSDIEPLDRRIHCFCVSSTVQELISWYTEVVLLFWIHEIIRTVFNLKNSVFFKQYFIDLEWEMILKRNYPEKDTSLETRSLNKTLGEGCVSNDYFRHSLDDSQISHLGACPTVPILECRWIVISTQPSLQTQFKVATVYTIHTQSLSWCSTGLAPNVLPYRDEGSGKPCAVDRASWNIGTHSGLELETSGFTFQSSSHYTTAAQYGVIWQ